MANSLDRSPGRKRCFDDVLSRVDSAYGCGSKA